MRLFCLQLELPAYSGAFLLTVENVSILLAVGAFLLMVLVFLLTVGAFLLTMKAFLLTVGKCV